MNLDKLSTERRNSGTMTLDQMSIKELQVTMNDEDQKVVMAIKEALPQIEETIEKVIISLNQKAD